MIVATLVHWRYVLMHASNSVQDLFTVSCFLNNTTAKEATTCRIHTPFRSSCTHHVYLWPTSVESGNLFNFGTPLHKSLFIKFALLLLHTFIEKNGSNDNIETLLKGWKWKMGKNILETFSFCRFIFLQFLNFNFLSSVLNRFFFQPNIFIVNVLRVFFGILTEYIVEWIQCVRIFRTCFFRLNFLIYPVQVPVFGCQFELHPIFGWTNILWVFPQRNATETPGKYFHLFDKECITIGMFVILTASELFYYIANMNQTDTISNCKVRQIKSGIRK